MCCTSQPLVQATREPVFGCYNLRLIVPWRFPVARKVDWYYYRNG